MGPIPLGLSLVVGLLIWSPDSVIESGTYSPALHTSLLPINCPGAVPVEVGSSYQPL